MKFCRILIGICLEKDDEVDYALIYWIISKEFEEVDSFQSSKELLEPIN